MLTVLRHTSGSMGSGIKSAARMATGRSAILHFMQRWNPSHVYMPAYVPEGVIKPCQAHGSEVIFYRLRRDLDIDLTDLEMMLSKHGGTRPVIVAIHYFGFPVSDLRDLARKYNAIVLSDCAHGFWGYDFADVLLYSFNKLIPVTDGAIIASRREDLDLSIGGLPEFSSAAVTLYEKHLEQNQVIAEADKASFVTTSALNQSSIYYEAYYKIISEDMQPYAMTAKAQAIEAATVWPNWAVARASRSAFLHKNILKNLLIRNEPAMIAFPIRCNQQRDEMCQRLIREGVIPHIQRDLWDHMPSSDRFEFEREFIEDHLLLPICDDGSLQHAEKMVQAVNSFAEVRVLQ